MATERIFLSGDYKTITYLNDQYYIYKETKIVVVFLYEIKLFVILAFHITMKFQVQFFSDVHCVSITMVDAL